MRAWLVFCIATAATSFCLHAEARDVLTASDAYILEAPPTARSNVGYIVLNNSSRRAVRLLAIDSDRFARHEMHSMREEGGVMQMRRERTLDVPARGTLKFEPGSYHLMLFSADPPLRAGEKVEMLLQSDSGDEVEVVFEVRAQPGMETPAAEAATPAADAAIAPAAAGTVAPVAPVAPAAPAAPAPPVATTDSAETGSTPDP